MGYNIPEYIAWWLFVAYKMVKKHEKSNSMVDAVQEEANLQEQLGNNLHFRQE